MSETRQVAVVSETARLGFEEVAVVAAALQRQVLEHLAAHWNVSAIVNAYRSLESVPTHYWPIMVVDESDGSAGIHEDDRGQPFALVAYGPSWSLAASHECLEMLVDPYGKTLRTGPVPTIDARPPPQSSPEVEFLVEICDPCESEHAAYEIDGILVSDFYTRDYFARQSVPGIQYSHNNRIRAPREVLKDGYLTWRDPLSGRWWQMNHVGDRPRFAELGVLDLAGLSIRQVVRRVSGRHYSHLSAVGHDLASMQSALRSRRSVDEGAKLRAEALRWRVDDLRKDVTRQH